MIDQKATDHEAMIRWQGYAREHRSAVNSLFLTYAGVLLGVQASHLLGKDVGRVRWPLAFGLAGFLGGASFLVGSIIVLVRLRDARLTARVARYRYEGRAAEVTDHLRARSDKLGEWTNRLILVQVITFFAGVASFAAWILAVGWVKF